MDLALPEPTTVPFLTRVWRTLWAMRRLNKNPADRDGQLAFVMALDQGALRRRLEFLASTDSGRRLIAERPALDGRHHSRASLLTRTPGTLGRELGEFLLANHIELFGAPASAPRDELEWMARRVADTHDCLHVMTGFGADYLGEIEVQAFMWSQWKPLTSLVVSFFGFAISCWQQGPLRTLSRFRRALALGRQAGRMDHLRWEELLDVPVAELRARFSLSD